MNLTLGVAAHVDAGKTTLCEQLLRHAGVIRACGRVDHGDAFMDDDPMERARGITIFTEQATLAWPVSGDAYGKRRAALCHADGYAGARRFFRRDGARAFRAGCGAAGRLLCGRRAEPHGDALQAAAKAENTDDHLSE